MKLCGTLYGLGAGAGNREWLTLEADRILREVPIIALPYGADGHRGRAEQIIAPYLGPEKTVLRLRFPMTRDPRLLHQAWEEAADQSLLYLRQPADVVFVTEGDPSLYSTFSYLAEAVKTQCPEVKVRIVPGISSILAGPARWGHALTKSHQSLAIIPASHNLEKVAKALDLCDTVVILKVAQVFEEVYNLLASRQLLTNTVYLSHIGLDDEEMITDISMLKERPLPYMSLLIVSPNGQKPMKAGNP
ncbi:precorrin-2/cobalt-factor-2 C20-methyltransferase [Sulfobacillus thermosulfidooxidans DSM 9293]|uniref:Precorrin-2/cobalt-factor-2 C20-methyltransferase n=1 Tax=Sulfobacillus thermosulfidooxidans (strain DSM 9293 / VKM B-1269 / AT-1) TaxID=929705 RepID=A0A1W1WHA9_SULTA|nr:precorrin-2 C(20)-methyltransferase [Sulfobacillus thermosulfidooxidans]SMC05572.1 precorrin-2/cobalt-factor-2 C20-methyltransferase [Sulfobacillus thermosulfidooxidans DSM 9293]